MILRPSKIFVSFHQLRHYVQSKISELVVTKQQQPSHTVTQLTNFATTQQSIVFFSDMQRSLVQKAYHFQPSKRNPINEKLLLKVIQQHFPIVKVFSQPTLYGRSSIWSKTHPTQQLRTMMSSSGGGGNTLMTWGFPRTAMVGVGRSNGFGATRQFSTTKSPTCVNFFQNTTPQQPNIFAHISFRIFSPAGTKMNQPTGVEEKPKFVPFYSLEPEMSSDDESICSGDRFHGRMFTHKANNGMFELINKKTESEQLYVRREATNVRRNKTKRSSKKLDHIIRHDDISSLSKCEEVGISHKNKRRLSYGNTASQHGRIKHPPSSDQRHQTKRKIANETKKNESAANVYLLIRLDSTPFLSTWSTQSLNSGFIDSVEVIAQNYQVHIQQVLNLLERLRFSGNKFRIVSRHSELRIYFPTSSLVRSEAGAIEFLKQLQIDEEEDTFDIIVEKQDEDYFNYEPHHSEHATVGPEYFKDLQMFLDRTDYLIQTSSSAFSGSSR